MYSPVPSFVLNDRTGSSAAPFSLCRDRLLKSGHHLDVAELLHKAEGSGTTLVDRVQAGAMAKERKQGLGLLIGSRPVDRRRAALRLGAEISTGAVEKVNESDVAILCSHV